MYAKSTIPSATIKSRALGALKLASEASCARWECARKAGRFFYMDFSNCMNEFWRSFLRVAMSTFPLSSLSSLLSSQLVYKGGTSTSTWVEPEGFLMPLQGSLAAADFSSIILRANWSAASFPSITLWPGTWFQITSIGSRAFFSFSNWARFLTGLFSAVFQSFFSHAGIHSVALLTKYFESVLILSLYTRALCPNGGFYCSFYFCGIIGLSTMSGPRHI